MRIDIAAQTDIGRRKKTNEDCYGVFREDTPNLALFSEGAMLCVADGLGGHMAGEIASKLAVSMVKDVLKEPAPTTGETPEERDTALLDLLRKSIERANERVHRTNREHIKRGLPMGTTLLVAVVEPKKVYIANVGDSRCYLIRDGEILLKTEDHSWVDEQVKLGLMSRSEAESDSRKNLVTRTIGTGPEVEVDTYVWHVVPGDYLLLCTDGLVNMVKDQDIAGEFKKAGTSADIAHRLVDAANANGGKDNITVIAAHINPNSFRLFLLRVKSVLRRNGRTIFWTMIAVLFGVACFCAGYLVRGGMAR